MNGFELFKLQVKDVKDEWNIWFESNRTQYYTRSGRQINVAELSRSIEEGLDSGTVFTYGIRDINRNLIIGIAKIGPIDSHHGLSEIAILIGDSEYLGKGLSATFIEKLSEIAFSVHGVRKLHSGILAKNIPSIKAFTRTGWIIEAKLHQHYVNNGEVQDYLLISKFNPAVHETAHQLKHAVDLNKILHKT